MPELKKDMYFNKIFQYFLQMPKRKPIIVVHLGNTGSKDYSHLQAQKTRAYAKRFPDFKFVGIDLRDVRDYWKMRWEQRLRNWDQIEADFIRGLEKFEDGSISVISSELAVGHYEPKGKERAVLEYTEKTLKLVHKKTEKGGRVVSCGRMASY